ncbi:MULTISPECIES: hypothetical protein [Streptomyces]|uniref:Uncharacterized protein n=1 Tax=Streptomyces xanthii TaxID=2768069 RepID=A0A7H1BBZ3_9ACTN|nr:hypothetical protein [Streptomyces xanthii]QNS06248.1 hypothetical protein IAG42_23485 [Streptomyces xanthii]
MTNEVERERHCPTCKSYEQHRHLTPEEDAWLRKTAGETYTYDWWRCKKTGCRTLRNHGVESRNVQLPEDFDD